MNFTYLKPKHFAKQIVSNILLRSHICRNLFPFQNFSTKPQNLNLYSFFSKIWELKKKVLLTPVEYNLPIECSMSSHVCSPIFLSVKTRGKHLLQLIQVISVAPKRSAMETEVQHTILKEDCLHNY